ncbi:MAG: nucleotidyltransferase family protein [Nitrospiraceae bacterium]
MLPSTLDRFVESYAQVGALNTRILDRLAAVGMLFQREQIDFLLLKGADLISRLYGIRGIRPLSDVDLLVREKDLPRIDTLLQSSGFVQQIDGNPAYCSLADHVMLDITTDLWYLDQTDLSKLWERAIPRRIGGRMMKCMGSEDLVLYLTAYAVIHRGQLSPSFYTDLALLLQREPVEWPMISQRAAQGGLRTALYHGLTSLSRSGYHPVPDRYLQQLAPSTMSERGLWFLLRKVVTKEWLPEIGHVLLLLTTPGRRKWHRLWALICPSTRFLGYRYGKQGTEHAIRTRVARLGILFARGVRLSIHLLMLTLTPTRR